MYIYYRQLAIIQGDNLLIIATKLPHNIHEIAKLYINQCMI